MSVKQLGKRASGSTDAATLADLSVLGTNPLPTATTAYTLALTDAGLVIEATSASAVVVTVPTNAAVPFPVGTVLEVMQYGTGQVTLAFASGVTPKPPGNVSPVTTRVQNSTLSLRYHGADVWIVGGDMT